MTTEEYDESAYDIYVQQETVDGKIETLHFERPQYYLAEHFASQVMRRRPRIVSVAMCCRRPGSAMVYRFPGRVRPEPGGESVPYVPNPDRRRQ